MTLLSHNTELTVYVNSKMLYIEQAYKRTLDSLYADAVYRRCLANREILKNRLLLAPVTPNALSTIIEHRLGYVGRVLGEVIYIVQCTPKIAQNQRMFQ